MSLLFRKNLLFSTFFLPNRSSCHQLLNCLHSWLVLFLSNKSTKVIYTDIQKAFDSVSHFKLIKTLTQYRIHKSLVSWFNEFLNNRTQKVVIGIWLFINGN